MTPQVAQAVGARARDHGSAMKALHWVTAVLVAGQITLALRAWKLPPGIVKSAMLAEHMSFGLCVLLLRLSGWSMVSAAGIAPSLFGVIPVPALLSTDAALHDSLKLVHLTLNTLLFAALLLHVAAALRHGLRRDGVLSRMLPRFGRGAGD